MSDAEVVDEEPVIQTGRVEREERAEDVTDVDWSDVWAIAGAEPGDVLSPTQAALCVQVSGQCPPETDQGGREYIERAVEAGSLEVERTLGVRVFEDDDPVLVDRGYHVAGGDGE